ncbi:MAG: asparagine synthase C-terminal domain-containing protein [Rudanella sp.]|nr:asparagine synthase C-terminal domain-containing protein [Rudanella sp.]
MCIFLSGGIDSGLITAIAARHQPGIRTFTMSFSEGLCDEAPVAQLVANQHKTQHTVVRVDTKNLADELLNILPHFGEPFMDSSALPSYWVAKAAREHVSVVLTGDGADELFGGYRRYAAARFGLFRLPEIVAQRMGILQPFLPHPAHKQSRYSHLYRLISMVQQSGISRYLSATTDVFGGYEANLVDLAPVGELEALIVQTQSLSGLQQLQWLDQNLLLPNDLLKKMDIATMVHSLEARNPFLSREVAELAFSLPDNLKIGWQRGELKTKFLLRQLAAKHLPSAVIRQPKRGFEVPLRQWLDGPLRSLTHDYLLKPSLMDSLVKPTFIRQLLHKPQQFPPEKRAKLLWMMLSIEIWHRNLFRHEG